MRITDEWRQVKATTDLRDQLSNALVRCSELEARVKELEVTLGWDSFPEAISQGWPAGVKNGKS